MNFLQYNRIY